ncbi:hypothetical protein CPB83DRAFT_777610, partial [Crepidotus variabilis]
VYLPALFGYVPAQVFKGFQAFCDFCYLIRRSVLDEKPLGQIDDALHKFHQYRDVFREAGEYAAPNGICPSITESKPVKALQKPWCRYNKFYALGQMLLTNPSRTN